MRACNDTPAYTVPSSNAGAAAPSSDVRPACCPLTGIVHVPTSGHVLNFASLPLPRHVPATSPRRIQAADSRELASLFVEVVAAVAALAVVVPAPLAPPGAARAAPRGVLARRRLGRCAPAYRPAPLSWHSSTASTASPSCRRSSSLVVLPARGKSKRAVVASILRACYARPLLRGVKRAVSGVALGDDGGAGDARAVRVQGARRGGGRRRAARCVGQTCERRHFACAARGKRERTAWAGCARQRGAPVVSTRDSAAARSASTREAAAGAAAAPPAAVSAAGAASSNSDTAVSARPITTEERREGGRTRHGGSSAVRLASQISTVVGGRGW